jgi:RluA family pseudouridine synthase
LIRILHQDQSLLAVDKPAGVLTARGRMGEAEPSLLDKLCRARREKLLLVHRLDRGTSGVLLLARGPEAQRRLSEAFEKGAMEKRYLALVRGAPASPRFIVDVALVPARRGKSRPAREGESGKSAQTEFEVLERFKDFTLLEARPRTGRSHQIRVHLKFVGLPLAVDPAYAGVEQLLKGEVGLSPPDEVLLARTPLHARSIKLSHPVTGKPLTIESPVPKDLAAALAHLRGLP